MEEKIKKDWHNKKHVVLVHMEFYSAIREKGIVTIARKYKS